MVKRPGGREASRSGVGQETWRPGSQGGQGGPRGLAIPWDAHPLPVALTRDLMEVSYLWTPG